MVWPFRETVEKEKEGTLLHEEGAFSGEKGTSPATPSGKNDSAAPERPSEVNGSNIVMRTSTKVRRKEGVARGFGDGKKRGRPRP